jgi:hypothetical protein
MVLCSSRGTLPLLIYIKNLPGLQFIRPDAMSLVRPPNSNGRTIPLTYMFTFVTESHYLISYCNSIDHEIKANIFLSSNL